MPSSEPTQSTGQTPGLRGREKGGHLVLEQAGPLLQVHHVTRIRDHDIPLGRVRELRKERQTWPAVGEDAWA
jgi:hypothetical protein